MMPGMENLTRIPTFWILVWLWTMAGLGMAFGWSLASERLWIGALALPALWAAVGLGLLARSCWRVAAHRETLRAPAAVAVLAGLTVVAAIPLAAWGDAVRIDARLRSLEPAVAVILERHNTGLTGTDGWQEGDAGLPFIVDAGPPARIAFMAPGGVIDNWTGIVYDPSGEVLQANTFAADWSNWDDAALATVKSLFGGDLYRCEHLKGPFYRCFFT